jgi:RHS repeat-associated protein
MTFNATPPTQTYTYDPENRLTGAAGYAYTYDGDGNRVRKSNGNLAANGTLYWYMTPGIVGESDLSGNLTDEYVFFGGERVARKSTNGVFYYFSDHLKTASVITDSAGVIKAESDYYPWGGELQFVANDSNHYKFTGKERDSETQLDYFRARYYSNGLGRWVSADWSATPVPVPYANFGDPQSLNQYAYVRNVPTTNVDPDGHDCPVCDLDQEVKELVQSLQHLTPAAAPAVASAAPAAVLALPSAGAMYLVATQPPMENHPADDPPSAGNMMLDALNPSYQPAPQETEHAPEPQVSTSGAGARQGGDKPYEASKENLDQMKQGKPPVGTDGKKVELHHDGQTTNSPLVEMTQTQHRGKGNFTQKHQNTGQRASQVNRSQAAKIRQKHWKNEHKKHSGEK